MKSIGILCLAALASGAFAFDASISVIKTGDQWAYTVNNNELPGSVKRPHAVYVTLDVSQDLTNVTSPPGWDFETDHRTYIVWVFLESAPITVTPAAQTSLSGFGFTAAGSFSVVAPMYVGSYDSVAMTEGEEHVGTTFGPADGPGGSCSGSLTLDAFDQQGQAYAMPFEFRDPNTNALVSLSLGFVAPDGSFGVRSPDTPGTYVLSCKNRAFLRKSWNVNTSPSGVSGLVGVALNGDSDEDNEIAIGDYAILSLAYGAAPGDPNWVLNADLNNDESVDIADYAVLSANYGEAGD